MREPSHIESTFRCFHPTRLDTNIVGVRASIKSTRFVNRRRRGEEVGRAVGRSAIAERLPSAMHDTRRVVELAKVSAKGGGSEW